MRQHYIPQYYLNGFSDSSGNVWVYEKGSHRVFCAGTKRIANETDYYSDELETYLADKVENPANKVIRKIRERKAIAIEDKITLSKYMIVMLKRVPQGKKHAEEKSPAILEKTLDSLEQELTNLISQHPDKPHLKQRQEEAKNLRRRIEKDSEFVDELFKDTWLKNLPPHMTPESVKALSLMTWQFLTFDKESAFLTSDNPVFYFSNIGIGNKNSEVTFPISNNIVLWATWRQDLNEGYFRTKETGTHQINRRTVSTATRYIYHSENADWVIKLANKTKHNIRKLT